MPMPVPEEFEENDMDFEGEDNFEEDGNVEFEGDGDPEGEFMPGDEDVMPEFEEFDPAEDGMDAVSEEQDG